MDKSKRVEQLFALKGRVAAMHRSLQWDQPGYIGRLVANHRTRLEHLDARINRRIATLIS